MLLSHAPKSKISDHGCRYWNVPDYAGFKLKRMDDEQVPVDMPIHYSVVYGLAQRQIVLEKSSDESLTARQAAIGCGMEKYFPELDASSISLAVYGELVDDDYHLQDGDRLEMLRELLLDPKEQRRRRALK